MLYPIAIESGDQHHAYGVTVPDLPGCFSAGDTLDEAIVNAKQAIISHIELLVEMEADFPMPSKIEDLSNKAEYQEYIWAIVEVDVTRLMGGAEKINVTLPKSLIARIDRVVALHPEYKSRSGFLAQAALEQVTVIK